MADKSVAEKARVKPGTTYAVLDGEPAVVAGLGMPADSREVPAEEAQIVMWFPASKAALEADMLAHVEGLAAGAALWVFWRKGTKAGGEGVGRDDIWAVAETLGMRPLGIVGVDETWSSFRLRRG